MMQTRKVISLMGLGILGVAVMLGLARTPQSDLAQHTPISDDRAAITAVLDDWHQAAADADLNRYFSYFASKDSIFMGTDATERWTRQAFYDYAKTFFDKGKAWTFHGAERHIYLAASGDNAWFDEQVVTQSRGIWRGTGVLVKSTSGWKIAHYNLSLPIPNDVFTRVLDLLNDKTSSSPDESQ